MEKTYRIQVDCPHCAEKIERAIEKQAGVESVSISFISQKMFLEFKDVEKEGELLSSIEKVGKKVDGDFRIL